ncbi:hypothetical protein [Streptomyces massasporeus]
MGARKGEALDAATAEAAFGSTMDAVLRGWATPAVFSGLRGAAEAAS